MLRQSSFWLNGFRKVAFTKRNGLGRGGLNMGLLSDKERGDSFTEPEVYRNRKNVTAQIKVGSKIKKLQREEKLKKAFEESGEGDAKLEQLRLGRRLPLTKSERSLDDTLAASTVEPFPLSDYPVSVHKELSREADRRNHVLTKFGRAPTSKEYYQLMRKLETEDASEEKIDFLQKRLVEEHGVYSSSRIDAYMLDDDSYFPSWVNALPYSVRDQVKYGGLGLTEEDEALRVRLNRLPAGQREKEWKRIKSAKEYQAANSEMLTLAELRDARQGKRRFHWLQRKRERRAQQLRRMALRNEESVAPLPSTVMDYSQRVAFIAQHVENGVQTAGQWPLSPEALHSAKVKKSKQQEESLFLERQSRSRDPQMNELLSGLGQRDKPFRRVSRKVYANRVNAVMHGDQDERGRKYRVMEGRARRRLRPYSSLEEIQVEKEVRKEPRVYESGLKHLDDENWNPHFKSWSDGMPSTRYGS